MARLCACYGTDRSSITAFDTYLDCWLCLWQSATVYLKKYAQGFVVLCFDVVMQSFIMNSHEVFIHIYQGCFAGTGAIVRLPQCQWSKPDGYGIISQCITTTKHSKAKTVCIFLGIYCMLQRNFGSKIKLQFRVTMTYLLHMTCFELLNLKPCVYVCVHTCTQQI